MSERSCYSVCSPGRLFVFRVVYSSIGILVGLSVAVVFPLRFNNINAGGWGFTSAVLAFLTLLQFIYLYVVKERQRKAPNPWVLFVFGLVGAVGLGAGVGGIAAYLGLGIIDSLNHRDLSLPASHYVVCVWCFMNFKWGITLFLYAIISFKYREKMAKYKPMANDQFQDDADEDIDEEIEGKTDLGQEQVEEQSGSSPTLVSEDLEGKT